MPLTTDAAARPDEQPKDEVVTTEIVPDLEKDEEITVRKSQLTVTRRRPEKDEEITIEEITVDGDKKKVIKRTKKPKQQRVKM
ncbi:hypothetical protein TYRP_010203 [Tyrophagus putrescentiae]|nr:hypothetical protein TYRP_010203 [Tyrophagus putrescentiae]